jgi:hypothetical protein
MDALLTEIAYQDQQEQEVKVDLLGIEHTVEIEDEKA